MFRALFGDAGLEADADDAERKADADDGEAAAADEVELQVEDDRARRSSELVSTSGLTREEVANSLRFVDLNGSGTVSHEELTLLLRALGLDVAGVRKLCLELGISKKKEMPVESLLKHAVWGTDRGRVWLRAMQECRVAFDKVDLDGSQTIEMDEFIDLLSSFVTDEEAVHYGNELYRRFCSHEDGKGIDYPTFVRTLADLRSQSTGTNACNSPTLYQALRVEKIANLTSWQSKTKFDEFKKFSASLPANARVALSLYRRHIRHVEAFNPDLESIDDETSTVSARQLRAEKYCMHGQYIPGFFRKQLMFLTSAERVHVISSMDSLDMLSGDCTIEKALHMWTWQCLDEDSFIPYSWRLYELENRRLHYRTARTRLADMGARGAITDLETGSPIISNGSITPKRLTFEERGRSFAERVEKSLDVQRGTAKNLPPYLMSELQKGMILSTKRRAVFYVGVVSFLCGGVIELSSIAMFILLAKANEEDALSRLTKGEMTTSTIYAAILLSVFVLFTTIQLVMLLKYALYLAFLVPRFAGINLWPISGTGSEMNRFVVVGLALISMELPLSSTPTLGINPLRYSGWIEQQILERLKVQGDRWFGGVYKVLLKRLLIRMVFEYMLAYLLILFMVYINCRIAWKVVNRVTVFALCPAYGISMVDDLIDHHFPPRVEGHGRVPTVHEDELVCECAMRAVAVVIGKAKSVHPAVEILVKHLAIRFNFDDVSDFVDKWYSADYMRQFDESAPATHPGETFKVLPVTGAIPDAEDDEFFERLLTHIAKREKARFVYQILALALSLDAALTADQMLYFKKVCTLRDIRTNLTGLKRMDMLMRQNQLDLADVLAIPTRLTDGVEHEQEVLTWKDLLWMRLIMAESWVTQF